MGSCKAIFSCKALLGLLLLLLVLPNRSRKLSPDALRVMQKIAAVEDRELQLLEHSLSLTAPGLPTTLFASELPSTLHNRVQLARGRLQKVLGVPADLLRNAPARESGRIDEGEQRMSWN